MSIKHIVIVRIFGILIKLLGVVKMLNFSSASARIANSNYVVEECLSIAFPDGTPDDVGIIVVNATLGHKLDRIAAAFKEKLPNTVILGSSCGGVTGREGVGESMTDLSMMAITGPAEEYAVATTTEIYGHNAYEKGLELAQSIKSQNPNVTSAYLLCPGIDIANDLVVKAFVDTFSEDFTIFGGTSSDNMRGLINYQYINTEMTEHGAWAVGFADKTLQAITRATHGFVAYGTPLVVTKSEGNKIIEFNGKPAWQEYVAKLSLDPEAVKSCGETIPIGALAEKLPDDIAEEYGNSHILRVVTKFDKDTGAIYYATTIEEGTEVWLTTRDEDLIFSEQERSLKFLTDSMKGKKPVAVFQTDCLARGRFLFNRVVKDEIIGMMQQALLSDGEIPPWLGMYGFGEYTILGGKNTFHNYSTALLVLCRE